MRSKPQIDFGCRSVRLPRRQSSAPPDRLAPTREKREAPRLASLVRTHSRGARSGILPAIAILIGFARSFIRPRWYRRPRTDVAPSAAGTAMRRSRSGGVIRVVGRGSGHQPNAGGRIMKLTRERLFGAPTVVRRAEERIERGRVAVSAARARATEIAQQCATQPRLRPNGLQRRRLERLNGMGSAQS
jgi:hypothetical protein